MLNGEISPQKKENNSVFFSHVNQYERFTTLKFIERRLFRLGIGGEREEDRLLFLLGFLCIR